MYRCRISVMGALFIAVPMAASALAQDTPDVQKELESAIHTIKETSKLPPDDGLKRELQKAVRKLIEHQEKALTLIVALLDENEPQMRLNAAITLARCAGKADPPSEELIAALKRVSGDSHPAVVYWGLTGLMNKGIPDKEKVAVVSKCLVLTQPRPLRLVAAKLAAENKVKEAAPVMVAHLKRILPSYRAQVKAKLTVSSRRGRDRDGRLRDDTGILDRDRYGEEARPRPDSRDTTRGTRMPQTGKKTQFEVDVRVMTPEEIERDPRDAEEWIKMIQGLPAVEEVHQVGLALEGLIAKTLFDSPFGFKKSPPWALDKCVEKAIAAFEEKLPEKPEKPKPVEAKPKPE